MKCDVTVKPEPKICKTCGFKTDDMFIMICPRCMSALPGQMSCGGGCSSCGSGLAR